MDKGSLLGAHIKFLNRKSLFSCRGKDYALTCNKSRSTLQFFRSSFFDKVIKNSISCYMVFFKEYGVSKCVTIGYKVETKEEFE